jgi:hypothetical protein
MEDWMITGCGSAQVEQFSQNYRVLAYSRRYNFPNNNRTFDAIIQPSLKRRTLPRSSKGSSSDAFTSWATLMGRLQPYSLLSSTPK